MSQDLDRVYTIPLGKALLSPDNHRAKRAINMIREFARRHMKIDDVRIDPEVAKLVWARGMRRPPRRIRVRMERTEEKHILITRYDERDDVAGIDAGEAPESPGAGAEAAAGAAAGAAAAPGGSDAASVSGPEAAGVGGVGPPALEGDMADASAGVAGAYRIEAREVTADAGTGAAAEDAAAAAAAPDRIEAREVTADAVAEDAAAAPDRIEAREVTADAVAEDAAAAPDRIEAREVTADADAAAEDAAAAPDAGGNGDKPDAANAPDGAAEDAAAGADNAGDSGGGGTGNDAAADADGDKKPGD